MPPSRSIGRIGSIAERNDVCTFDIDGEFVLYLEPAAHLVKES